MLSLPAADNAHRQDHSSAADNPYDYVITSTVHHAFSVLHLPYILQWIFYSLTILLFILCFICCIFGTITANCTICCYSFNCIRIIRKEALELPPEGGGDPLTQGPLSKAGKGGPLSNKTKAAAGGGVSKSGKTSKSKASTKKTKK